MSNKIHRNFLSVSSKYQWQILFLTIVPVVVGYFLLVGFVDYVLSQVAAHISRGTSYEDLIIQIPQMTIKLSLILIVFSMASGIFALVFSQNLFGPFDRINRELDDIIAGRRKKIITVRPNDQFAQNLLKRVNVLVESYVGQAK